MAGRMRDKGFREEQLADVRAEHVAPINALVDRIKDPAAELWAPYIVSGYGGTSARLLSVLRDPGPKTKLDHGGSGLLSTDNDDPTAKGIADGLSAAGIAVTDVLPWNIYPWYINRKPTTVELDAGAAPLVELIALLPELRVVMLHGGSAHQSWRRLVRNHPEIRTRGLTVIETFHIGRQAFWHRDPEVRQYRRDHLAQAFQDAARAVKP
jgi:hypothetical protein